MKRIMILGCLILCSTFLKAQSTIPEQVLDTPNLKLRLVYTDDNSLKLFSFVRKSLNFHHAEIEGAPNRLAKYKPIKCYNADDLNAIAEEEEHLYEMMTYLNLIKTGKPYFLRIKAVDMDGNEHISQVQVLEKRKL